MKRNYFQQFLSKNLNINNSFLIKVSQKGVGETHLVKEYLQDNYNDVKVIDGENVTMEVMKKLKINKETIVVIENANEFFVNSAVNNTKTNMTDLLRHKLDDKSGSFVMLVEPDKISIPYAIQDRSIRMEIKEPLEEDNTAEFKKGDTRKFLDYTIKYCTNNDGMVLQKTSASLLSSHNAYEMHLGNFNTLDSAQIAAVVYFMIARPNIFATSIMQKIMGHGGTCHEFYLMKDCLKKEGIEMPKEITSIDGSNCLIGYKGKALKWSNVR